MTSSSVCPNMPLPILLMNLRPVRSSWLTRNLSSKRKPLPSRMEIPSAASLPTPASVSRLKTRSSVDLSSKTTRNSATTTFRGSLVSPRSPLAALPSKLSLYLRRLSSPASAFMISATLAEALSETFTLEPGSWPRPLASLTSATLSSSRSISSWSSSRTPCSAARLLARGFSSILLSCSSSISATASPWFFFRSSSRAFSSFSTSSTLRLCSASSKLAAISWDFLRTLLASCSDAFASEILLCCSMSMDLDARRWLMPLSAAFISSSCLIF
mmetsp:Transcript_31820/g.63098  ORF Transcript_31820/g.63098 Transcript_31820/m.63098 type:complete len:272 (-) Transcript_31820:208-1023(-)